MANFLANTFENSVPNSNGGWAQEFCQDICDFQHFPESLVIRTKSVVTMERNGQVFFRECGPEFVDRLDTEARVREFFEGDPAAEAVALAALQEWRLASTHFAVAA